MHPRPVTLMCRGIERDVFERAMDVQDESPPDDTPQWMHACTSTSDLRARTQDAGVSACVSTQDAECDGAVATQDAGCDGGVSREDAECDTRELQVSMERERDALQRAAAPVFTVCVCECVCV